ncbi:golgin subfamily B member 1 isoform X2 [Protopterus annectens]|uniref:golgin subfamily B member 1 isoform X2 n=1 Tax=Protopterus annectens TaxID=7888 RepID=UPI001CFA13E5|nr:golgin subfamily B member 1 isoform X2 [Protopterus annectens]
MFSRLAKGVNTVLQELSRDADEIEDEDIPKEEEVRDHQVSKEDTAESPKEVLERLAQTEQLVVQLKELIREKDAQLQQKETALKAQEHQVSMETSVKGSEEVLERLAQTEQLVVQLKELIREKDAQLQQKEAALKEEKELADVKLSKLKLQAKAKVASLNKQLEELRKRTAATSPSKQLSEESELDSSHEGTDHKLTEDQGEELEKLKVHLKDLEEASRVQAEVVISLQQQLQQAQEQIKDHTKEEEHRLNEEKMQELEKLKSYLQEQEEASRVWEEKVDSLQKELQQTREQLEENMRQQQEKLQSLQAVIQEKDLRFQEQLQRHEEELLQVASATDSSAELQQTLKSQQRKLEELEEALHGRTLVVEMLQQELNNAEQQKQVLGEQLQQTETEVMTLKNALEQEKEVMKGLLEKQDLLVKDKDLALARLEETVNSLTQQLQEAKTAYSDLTEKHMAEITNMQTYLSELRATCDVLSLQNQELKTVAEEEAMQRSELLQKVAQLEDDVNVKTTKNTELESLLATLKEDSDAQLQQLVEQLKNLQEQDITALQNRVVELEDDKGTLLLSTVDLEELKAENESLRARLATLEIQSEQKTSQVDGSGTSAENHEDIQQEITSASQCKTADVIEDCNESIFIQTVPLDLCSSEEICSNLPPTQSSSDSSEQATPPVQPSTDLSVPAPPPDLHSSTTSEQAPSSDQPTPDGSEQAPPPAESSTDVSEQASTTLQPSADESDVLLLDPSCAGTSDQPAAATESSIDVLEQEHQPSPATVHVELIEEQKSSSQEVPFPQDESTVLVLKEMIAEKDKEISELMEKFIGAKEELAKLREEIESRTSRHEPEAQIVTWGHENELENITEHKDLLTVKSDRQSISEELSEAAQESVTVIQHEEIKKDEIQVHQMVTTFTTNKYSVWKEVVTGHETVEMSSDAQRSIHKEEIMKLKASIVELNEKVQEMEISCKNALDEKDSEISKLNLECRQQAEDLNEALRVLTNEKDELHSQVQLQADELSHMQELREKLQVTEESLADAERQRLSEYESRGLQNCLLEEQVESLQNESRSKDLKTEALHKDMDHIQLQLSEKEHAVQTLVEQLREKEQTTENLKESLLVSKNNAEELSLLLASKEDEVLRKEQVLSEREKDVEHLRRALTEKEQEMSEITLNMSNKIVLLNEEKYTQEQEINSLKEQLNLLHKTQVEKDEEKDSITKARTSSFELQNPLTEGEMLEIGTEEKENVHSQMEHLKRQNEQVKRKLHAALINRKELLKKVEELEMELKSKEMAAKESLSSVTTDDSMNTLTVVNFDDERQEVIKYLTAQLLEKDQELQVMKQDMEEKAVLAEQLKNSVVELTQTVKDKENEVEDLKIKAVGQQSVSQEQALLSQYETQSMEKDSFREVAESDLTCKVLMDHKTSEAELKLSSLEQEKEILQKKLQEALASRKATIRKSQEKDRHHREQLKQQKEEYNDLLETFEERNKEKEELQQHLKELQAQLLPIAGRHPEDRTVNLTNIKEDLPIVEHQVEQDLKESGWGQEWVDISGSDHRESPPTKIEPPSLERLKKELEQVQLQRDELQIKLQNAEVICAQKTSEFIQLQDKLHNLLQKFGLQQIEDFGIEVESIRKKCEEAETCAEGLKLALANSEAKASTSDELFNLKKEAEDLRNVISQKNKETEHLDFNLKEQSEAINKLQSTLLKKEDLINSLQTQLENQIKEHEEQQKRLQDKMHESIQKQGEDAEDAKSKQQLQRKLQAALISRKDALKENKALKEDLSASNVKLEELTKKAAITEKAVIDLSKEKQDLLEEINKFRNEKDKLVAEIDKMLLENHNLSSTCESLKLAIDGVTQEKQSLENEFESLKRVQDALHLEWQDKHKDMQKEYETLLQSYENVSNEMERMQRVLETVRLEKQELIGKIKGLESEKKETEKQVQEAQQEIEGMKEKMRKFAKSKQQKILELEEENDRLRAEQNPEASYQRNATELSSFETTQLREDLTKLKSEYQSLANELESTKAENAVLEQEVNILKEKLQLVETELQDQLEKPGKVSHSEICAEEVVVQHTVPVCASAKQSEEGIILGGDHHSTREKSEEEEKHVDSGLKVRIDSYVQQIAELTEMLQSVEKDKMTSQDETKRLNAALQSLKIEKAALESEVTHTSEELRALQKTSEEIDRVRKTEKEELEKMKQLKNIIETEKDDLEEKLMNQLAELNGSIANYQQTVSNLQAKISQLELNIEDQQKKIGETEEEVRQLLRQKAEDESKMQKEYEEKLKSAHRGKEGSKTHTKELQELLKEKQEEVRQLQKDCIRYQERMTDLNKMVKALEFINSDCHKEVEAAKKNWVNATEESKKKQAELMSCRILLDDTQSELARVLAENLKLKDELQTYKQQVKIQLKKKEEEYEQKIEVEKDKCSKEVKNTEEKMEMLQREKEHSEQTILELRETLEQKKQEFKQLHENLNENLAKLAAFTRSMSSLQDDRDRVIDETKKWEKKFQDTIRMKEEEVRTKEELCSVLKDQLRQTSIYSEELQIRVSRLEHNEQDWASKLQMAVQNHKEVYESLQEENKELQVQLQNSQKLNQDAQTELAKLNNELKELQTLQAEYLRSMDELAELPLLKSKLETAQQQLKEQHSKEDVLQQEHSAFQQELLKLRTEKQSWALQNEQLKEQYLIALTDKDLQLNDLQRLVQDMRVSSGKLNITNEQYQREALPEAAALVPIQNMDFQRLEAESTSLKKQLEDCLKELHQKELRIQQLNGKLSQVFEEKNALSIQLRRSGQNLRDTQLRYTELQSRYSALEAKTQKLQGAITQKEGTTEVDTAPGAPQEKIVAEAELYQSEVQLLQHRLSEAKEQQNITQQEMIHLSDLLNEERELRFAAEEALDTAQEELRRYEGNEWVPAQEHSPDVSAVHEHSLLIEPPDSVPSSPRARGSSGLKRLMRYLFFSRTRTPLLIATYLLIVHVLLILCFTGHL